MLPTSEGHLCRVDASLPAVVRKSLQARVGIRCADGEAVGALQPCGAVLK